MTTAIYFNKMPTQIARGNSEHRKIA